MGVETELQRAIFAALNGVISVPVYDEVPQEDTETDADFPFVTIGETDFSIETNDLGDSFEAVLNVHIWSRYRGRIEAKDIQAEIYDVLHRADALTIAAPFTIYGLNFVDSRTLTDPDGITRHGVSTFQVFIDTPQGGC